MNRIVYIRNKTISLVAYTPSDDRVLYEDWLDPDTQRGYNGVHVTTFEDYQSREIRQRFFAMIRLNVTDVLVGAVGISPPEMTADLAIWIFRPYRTQGYGTAAFGLATQYATEVLKIDRLHAGAYPDNTGSVKILKRCGYVRNPGGDIHEKHYLTGADRVQWDYIYAPVVIRLAVPADAPGMAQVLMKSWEVAYKDIIPADFIREKNATRVEQYKRGITEDNTTQYVIQRSGKTIGILWVAPSLDDDLCDRCYDVHAIYLHPDYCRQGIGTQVMGFAADIARKAKKECLTVWVLADNRRAIAFYETCGFACDGVSKDREYGKVLKMIRMRKGL